MIARMNVATRADCCDQKRTAAVRMMIMRLLVWLALVAEAASLDWDAVDAAILAWVPQHGTTWTKAAASDVNVLRQAGKERLKKRRGKRWRTRWFDVREGRVDYWDKQGGRHIGRFPLQGCVLSVARSARCAG